MSSRSPYSSPNSKSPRADMSHRLARLSEPAFAPSTSTSQQSTDSAILSVAYSPDGDSIATGSKDGVVVSWNLDFENCTSTMREHTASVYHVCWCREGGLIASASADNNVALWDPSQAGSSTVLRGHQGAVRCCSFSPDDSLLASSSGIGDTHPRPFHIHSRPFSLSVTVLWLCPCLTVPHSLAVPLCLTHSLAVTHSLCCCLSRQDRTSVGLAGSVCTDVRAHTARPQRRSPRLRIRSAVCSHCLCRGRWGCAAVVISNWQVPGHVVRW